MMIFGLVLALVGVLLGGPLLGSLGILVALIGAALAIIGYSGHGSRARRHYW